MSIFYPINAFRLRLRLRSSIQDHDGVRQQFNGLSSFLDAANVYGYNKQRALQVVSINAKKDNHERKQISHV